jgi:protein TonB
VNTSPASFAPSLGEDLEESGREPLSLVVRRGLLALVIFFHVGIGWALTQVEPPRLIVGETAAMEVRMVAAEPSAPPQTETPQLETPPPEDTPPPEPQPQLESMIQPPLPDLPPPVFPVDTPLPPPPTPPPPKPRPAQAAPAAGPPQAAPPAAAAAPKTVPSAQVGYLVPPNPIYPPRSRRANEQGVAMVRVLIDVAGRPTQVSLQGSSGHKDLDESALNAVRAAQFRPYAEGGIAQPVWVLIPIKFVLK